jgi:hypothetical protein
MVGPTDVLHLSPAPHFKTFQVLLIYCRKLAVLKPEGTRRLGKRKLRWLDSVDEDLKKIGVRNWRRSK